MNVLQFFLSDNNQFDKSSAFLLKLLKVFCFDFVAIVCNSIARCIVLTISILKRQEFKSWFFIANNEGESNWFSKNIMLG